MDGRKTTTNTLGLALAVVGPTVLLIGVDFLSGFWVRPRSTVTSLSFYFKVIVLRSALPLAVRACTASRYQLCIFVKLCDGDVVGRRV